MYYYITDVTTMLNTEFPNLIYRVVFVTFTSEVNYLFD